MKNNYSIRPENSADIEHIRAVHTAAFGQDAGIGDMTDDLRGQGGGFKTLSHVATLNDRVVGHVMVSHAFLDTDKKLVDVAVLSPLGVAPNHQEQGIGTALIKAAIKATDDLGLPMLFLEGHHLFYGTRGFENATDLGVRRPSTRIPSKAFQVAKLSSYDESLTGTFVYRDVHWRHGVGLYRNG